MSSWEQLPFTPQQAVRQLAYSRLSEFFGEIGIDYQDWNLGGMGRSTRSLKPCAFCLGVSVSRIVQLSQRKPSSSRDIHTGGWRSPFAGASQATANPRVLLSEWVKAGPPAQGWPSAMIRHTRISSSVSDFGQSARLQKRCSPRCSILEIRLRISDAPSCVHHQSVDSRRIPPLHESRRVRRTTVGA